jgi:hypothetical protein
MPELVQPRDDVLGPFFELRENAVVRRSSVGKQRADDGVPMVGDELIAG